MRILIIGGTGFVGPPIVRRLVAAGHHVTVYHRGEHEPELPRSVRHVHHPEAATPVLAFPFELQALAPQVVLHMTLNGQRDAQAVVGAFRGAAGRLVMLSSVDVYRAFDILRGVETGPPELVPLREDARLRSSLFPHRGVIEGMDEYDKILAERVVMGQPDLPGTVLRLPMVYGPGDTQHRFFRYLKRIDDHRRIIVMGHEAGWRSAWGYVENVAEAVALAIEHDESADRIYNVADTPVRTLRDWVEQIAVATGWMGQIVSVPRDNPMLGSNNWRQDVCMDTTRIRAELGFTEPVSVEASLDRTIAWERQHPPEIDSAQFDYAAEDQLVLEEES